MAAAAAGILNHAMTAGQALTGKSASPMASSTSGTGDINSTDESSSNSATISANDFLTLLVTEMQNQDPTANTDPNEYINQLVQVNSLEQLIDINQTLSGDVSNAATSSDRSPSAQTVAATSGPSAGALSGVQSGLSVAQTRPASVATGNLSVPVANAAAKRVGHALDGGTPGGKVPATLATR